MRHKLHRPQWLRRHFWVSKVKKVPPKSTRATGPNSEPNSDAAQEARASEDLQKIFGDPRQVQVDKKSFKGSGDAENRSNTGDSQLTRDPRDTTHVDRKAGPLKEEEILNLVRGVHKNREASTISNSTEAVYGASSLSPSTPGRINGNIRRPSQDSAPHQSGPGLRAEDNEASVVSELTGKPYTIVRDGGQDLQSKLDRPKANGWEGRSNSGSRNEVPKDDENESRPEPESNVLEITNDKLFRARIASAPDSSKWFIPKSSLINILTVEIVSSILRTCTPKPLDEKKRIALSRYVVGTPTEDDPSPKTYQAILALLLRLKRHELITEFVDHGIDDSRLPLADGDWEEFSDGSHRLDLSEGDKGYLMQHQWEFIPAYFGKKGKKIPHYELLPGHVLPYVHMDKSAKEMAEEERRRHLKGSFGKVSIYHLHEGQQGLERHTIEGQNGLIAVKRLISDDKTAFLEECKVLMRLTPKPTPHLAKLLATYEQPLGRDKNSPEFFLMFECAESNLEQFWKTCAPEDLIRNYGLNRVQLSRWVATQCRGLAQALRTLHSHTEDRVASTNEESQAVDQPSHGLHGDIKPANILRYTNWKDPQDPSQPLHAPLGVLQITDFGLSSYHHTLTAQDIKIQIGTSPYKPPEAHLIYPVSQSLDIWTMGCLFLEFVTWLILGDKGREEFCKKRGKSNKDLVNDSQECFFDVRERNGTTQVSKSRAVISWAEKLCNKECSKFVYDFVELIISRMLVIDDKVHFKTDVERAQIHSRISAKSLADELQRLFIEEDDYYRPMTKPRAQDLQRYNQPECMIIIKQSIDQVRSETRKRYSINMKKQGISRRNTADASVKSSSTRRETGSTSASGR